MNRVWQGRGSKRECTRRREREKVGAMGGRTGQKMRGRVAGRSRGRGESKFEGAGRIWAGREGWEKIGAEVGKGKGKRDGEDGK